MEYAILAVWRMLPSELRKLEECFKSFPVNRDNNVVNCLDFAMVTMLEPVITIIIIFFLSILSRVETS